MNKTKLTSARTYLLLFLMIRIMLLGNFFVIKAQRQSAPPELEGIQYEGPILLTPGLTGLTNSQAHYIFEKQGKVTYRIITITSSGTITQQRYNSITQKMEPTMVFIPGSATWADEIGEYKQNSSEVRLEFSDRYIEATVKADGLEGVVTFKALNKKEHWVVKTSGTAVNSSPSETPKPTQPITHTDREKRLRRQRSLAALDSPQPITDLDKAKRIKRIERALYLYNDGEGLYAGGEYNKAIAKFNEAINLIYDIPSRFNFYCGRGRAKVKLQDYRRAIEDFDKCFQNVKGNKPTLEEYQLRGDAKLATNDYKGALADYNLFLQLFEKPYEPEQGTSLKDLFDQGGSKAEVYKNRGTAKYKLGDKSGACADFRESCELGNNSACDVVKIVCN
jgi:hypothetical protein